MIAQESLDVYRDKVRSGSIIIDREKVYDYILECGGATIWQVANHFHVSDNRLSGRFIDLVRDGRIVKSPTVQVRNPVTGKKCRLYIPCEDINLEAYTQTHTDVKP